MVYTNSTAAVGRGAGLVAGAVIRAGHDLEWFDTHFTPAEETARRIVEGSFDAVLISSMTMNFSEARQVARGIKEHSKVPILLGGLHPTIAGPDVLAEHPEFDYGCVGEGESFVVEYLERLGTDALTGTANLLWRDGEEVRANPTRPAEDMAALPDFPWHLFPQQSIVHGKDRFLYVNASRGCPFNCTYCCNGIVLRLYGKSYLRYRPVDDFLREVAHLKTEYSPRAFYLEDEMLFFNRELATEVFEGLNRLGVKSGAMARVESIDQELVDMLASNGLRFMAIGVECGDEEFRREFLNRRMANEQIEHAVALLKGAGIYTKTLNMIGYPVPGDDELTRQSVAFTDKLAPDAAQFTIFYPFPGTKLYDYCLENDLIDPAKWNAASNYYDDSVLRGVSLAKVRNELEARFNPLSQDLEQRILFSDGSWHSRYEIARAWFGLERRRLGAALTGKKDPRLRRR